MFIFNENFNFIRDFGFKDKIDIKNLFDCYEYGLHYTEVEIKYKQIFPKILCTKRKIEILSVKYEDIEVECVNNIPQYWKYPEHFALIQSLGKCNFTNDKEMAEHWKDYGDGLYSGYFMDRKYGLLGYEAYQKINGYIFKKWSRNYQSTVDIFPENIENFHPKNIKYTITSFIGNVTVLEKEDTIAIYGSNEFAAKAIINANGGFKESKLGADKILAVGFDSGALQQDAIRKGIFVGSVTQDPVQIGYQAVKLAIAAAKGETVKDVDTGSKWYDAKNIDSEEIKALLYE